MRASKKMGVLVALLLVVSWMQVSSIQVSAASSGVIFTYYEKNVRCLYIWVIDDVNGDGWREVCVTFPAVIKCFDLNPANDGPKQLWKNYGFHHEIYGLDSGIDVNGDNITEQLVFEWMDNYHYLLDGATGTFITGNMGDGRRSQLSWPVLYHGFFKCGVGLGTNVNGQGSDDYVIIGTTVTGPPKSVLQCREGNNGSLIWERDLELAPRGVQLLQINSSQSLAISLHKLLVL
ncbi:MAG: hypothetical protein ACTSRS_06340 [Candidatus Helarchaeota archaeon]